MDRDEMENKIVVITGASSGMGRATALEFARNGNTVVLAARRKGALEVLAEECERIGGQALSVPTDVSKEDEVNAIARKAWDKFGRLDVWVNNAAVTLFGRLEEVPTDAVHKVLDTNLMGYIYGARAVLPYFREQGHGILINLSSVVGVVGQPYTVPYVVSKFAIRGLSLSLQQELADEKDIHVCSVLPAAIDTPLFQHGANYMGWAVKPLQPILHAQRVADIILSLARTPKKEVFVGLMGPIGVMARAVAPNAYDRFFRKIIYNQHFQDTPAEPTTGNLYHPMSDWASISGGWKEQNTMGSAIPLKHLLIAGAVIGALAAAFYSNTKRKISHTA